MGQVSAVEGSSPADLCALLHQLRKAGAANPHVLGCFPFVSPQQTATTDLDSTRPNLFVAANTLVGSPMPWFGGATETPTDNARNSPASVRESRHSDVVSSIGWHIDREQERSSRDAYRSAVRHILERIAADEVQKVVLARVLDLVPQDASDDTVRTLAPAQLTSLVRNVLVRQPTRYGFAARLPSSAAHGKSSWLLGVSPELLINKHGRWIESFPLAGSVPRSDDRHLNSTRAAALLHSEKDLREHAFVVDAIADTLAPFCRELNVAKRPELVSTPTVLHLGTPIRGRLTDPTHSSLALALALHPTPAVCGTPTKAALKLIHDLEGFSRDYYAGMVGWCDASGDGEWAVSIRCGELTPQRLRLYAGAGLVNGSEPDAELAETDAKLRALLVALRINPIAHVA